MKNIFSERASRQFYKPTATRTPVLLVLLTITISLFVLTELAIRHIPAHQGIGKLGNAVNDALHRRMERRALLKRQSDSSHSFISAVPTKIGSYTTAGTSAPAVSTLPPFSYSTASGPYLTPGAGSTGPSSIMVTPTLPTVGEVAPIESSSPGNGVSTVKDGWLTPGDPSDPTITGVPAGGRLSVGSGNTPTTGSVTTGPANLDELTPLPAPRPTSYHSATGGYLTPGVHLTPGKSTPSPAANNGQTINPIPAQSIPTPAPGVVITDAKGSSIQAPVMTVVGGHTYALTPGVTVNGGTSYTQTPIVTMVDGKLMAVTPAINVVDGKTYTQVPIVTVIDGNTYAITPYITVKDGKTFTTTPLPIVATASGGYNKPARTDSAIVAAETIVNSTGVYYKMSTGEILSAPQITLRQYILVAFVPLIVAVLYTLPWRVLDSTFREMEPFYQLSRPGGGSLCLDYTTSWLITIPFKASFRGHFIPLWSSLISMSVLFIAPLASEAFFVSVYGDCVANSTGECRAVWGVYPALARAIQGILGFIFVLLLLLVIFNFKRQTGVYSEPLSLAGLAVLLSKSPLLKMLRQIDSMVSNKELKQIMDGKRFRLSNFVAEDQTHCHGIVPVDVDSERGFASSGMMKQKKGAYTSVRLVDDLGISDSEGHPAPKMGMINWNTGISMKKDAKQKLMYFAAFLIIAGLLTLISYYHWTGPDPVTGKSTGFETFMDSQGFGIRFMMTGLGVGIKLLWTNVDSDLRRDTPFIHLLRGSSHPKDSILLQHHASHLSAILPSITRLHFLSAIVALLAFLAEFLPILLANIAYSPAMTKDAYTVCHFLSMAILILMVFVILFLLIKRPSGVGSLPRRPGKGGPISTAIYLAAPSEADSTFGNVFGRESERERGLLDCLAGLSATATRERDDAIKGLGSLYSMGVVDGGEDMRSGMRRSAGQVSEELRIDDDRRVRRLLKE